LQAIFLKPNDQALAAQAKTARFINIPIAA